MCLFLSLLLLLSLAVPRPEASVPITTDDVNEGRVKTAVCKTAIFNMCQVNVGSPLHLNSTIGCLLGEIDWLDNESTCYMYLNSVVANLLDSCASDQEKNCGGIEDSTSSATLTCLASHYYSVSPPCSAGIELLLGNIIPCVSEANSYCPTETDPVHVMQCLNTTVGIEFSAACAAMVHSYVPAVAGYSDFGDNDDTEEVKWSKEEDHDDSVDTDDADKDGTSTTTVKRKHKVENDDGKMPFEDTEPESLGEETYFTVVGGIALLIVLLVMFRCIRACCGSAQSDIRFGSADEGKRGGEADNKGAYVRAAGDEEEDWQSATAADTRGDGEEAAV